MPRQQITLLLLALVCACALPQPSSRQPLPTAATYAASKNAVWVAVMSEIAINFRVQTLDRESGFLGLETTDISIGPGQSMTEWVFMPDVLLGHWQALSLSMNILVEELDANMTRVTIRADYQALETNVYRAWIPCETNGRLEHKMLLAVGQRL